MDGGRALKRRPSKTNWNLVLAEYFLCYLCFQWVSRESWESGSHRVKCGDKNEAVMRAMPSLYNNLRCPTCREMLKLWPRDRGGAFRCKGPDCPLLGKRVEVSAGWVDISHFCLFYWITKSSSEEGVCKCSTNLVQGSAKQRAG